MSKTPAVIAALALAFPVAAQAHFLKHKHGMDAQQHVAYFQRSIAHDRAQVARDQRYLRRLVKARFTEITGARPLYRLIEGRARWHRHAFRWHRLQLERWQAKAARGPFPIDSCTRTLLDREGGMNPHATNPTSGAYGGPQALPGSKMASAGPDWRDNIWTQIRWMIGYMNERYGGSCAALAHSYSHGYY